MNKDAQAVFTEYFGSISSLHDGLGYLLFLVTGIAWMIITAKKLKEDIQERKNDGSDVFSVMVRGLAMLLILVAFLLSS
jgi:hypothetical protein